MSSFSHCPQCQQPVAVPDAADPSARVRCPHCQAEFSLSDISADRTDGPPDVILVAPPPAEPPLVAGPSAETAAMETPLDKPSPAGPPTIEASPETAQLEQEALDLAKEASALQDRAEGLQVTAHTSDPEPEAAAAQAEALDGEAEALAVKVEAIADPAETLDEPTARPATVAGMYRAMGGALLATADALDAVADVIQHKSIASQPQVPHEHPLETPHELPLETPPGDGAAHGEAGGMFDQALEIESEQTPVSELDSDLVAALLIGDHLDEKPKADEAPLPTSNAEPFLPVVEPAAMETVSAVTDQPATEPVATEPVATEPAATEPVATEPAVTDQPTAEPAATVPATAAESPVVDASSLLLKAVNLRSKAEALRARGQGLLTRADALTVAPGAEFEAGEDGQGGEDGDYEFHGDWAAAGLGPAAGGSAAAATAAGGTAMPFPLTPRKQKKPKSVVRELVAVVLGGLTALVLTFLVLNLFSDQYEFGIWPKGFRHLLSSTGSKDATPVRPVAKPVNPGGHAGPVNGGKPTSPAAPGQGTQAAQAGPEKRPAGKPAPLASSDLKPGPLDSSSGDFVPTTLPSDDTLPGQMVSPLKPEGLKAQPAPKAEEPKTEEKPGEPKPQQPSADAAKFGKVVDPLKPPAYGSEDLGWALTNAKNAFQGDLKPESYIQLCHLAEVLTFVDPQKGVTDLSSQKAAVEKLLRDVGERGNHKNVMAIAKLAPKWLDNPDREYPGILLAGRIQKIVKTSQGTTAAVITLAKPDKNDPIERTIKMASKQPLDLQEKDAVIILGGLGVTGQGDHKELAVIHGMTVKFAVPPLKPK